MLLALLLLASPDVLDVDPVAGPYTQIRSAVAAASDGDVIRVAPGDYEFFGVFGKSLTIAQSDPVYTARVTGSIRVQNLNADQTVVISGISAEALPFSGDSGLTIANCRGSVRIESGIFDSESDDAIVVLASDDVVLTDCEGRSDYFPCIDTTDSALTLVGGSYWGSSLFDEPFYAGSQGVTAISVTRGSLFTQGTVIVGGFGGEENSSGFYCTVEPGPGGDGVHVHNAAFRTIGSSIFGGLGGEAFWCDPAESGQRITTSGQSTVTEYPGDSVALDLSSDVVAEGGVLGLSAFGSPGDSILLIVGAETTRADLPAYIGDLHIGGSPGGPRRVLMGSSPAQLQLVMPQLPTFGTDAIFLQAVQLRQHDLIFSGPRQVTILDGAW